MADLGTDIAGVSDISPTLTTVSGRTALIQAVARRLITPRGGLFYDPDYGFDLRQYLSGIIGTPGEISSNVEAEVEKDERVLQASADVTFTAGNTLTVKLAIADAGGPFKFVLSVTNVTVELLSIS